ncbi:MAG: Fic family protein [Bdellovibrio sp.]|nr:Fic family protein [Bdellovibrio sp.]
MEAKKNHKTLQKKPQNTKSLLLPPLIFAAQNKSEEAWITSLKKKKLIRKIGPRLYTSVSKVDEKNLVRGQWAQIINHLYPEALLSHRSALEFKPSNEDIVVLTSTTNRQVKYPGLTLKFVRGPGRRSDENKFLNFYTSSEARAYLENFMVSKNTHWKTLPTAELEQKLETLLQIKGEEKLTELRDKAREISNAFDWPKPFSKLDQMIGALLGTRDAQSLESPLAKARAQQKPFDIERVNRFDILFSDLKANPLKEVKESFLDHDHFRNKAFFESYFSNYIEGTTFEIEEAEEIIFDKKIPADRPKDAHDIVGTFNIVSDPNQMRQLPHSPQELEDLIKTRHGLLMENRPESFPGKYKMKPNRAGDTHFVHPQNIQGTLEQGFQRYQNLPEGLPRAIFIMFLIAEIHPFTDGNGRIARIMMNAELYAAKQSTIIIPNVYRDDYLLALRALTRRDRPDPYIRMLARAHRFSSIQFTNYKKVLSQIENMNWFRESSEAKLVE